MSFINNVRCDACHEIRYQSSRFGLRKLPAGELNLLHPICPSCGAVGVFYDSVEKWEWQGRWWNPFSWMRGRWIRRVECTGYGREILK